MKKFFFFFLLLAFPLPNFILNAQTSFSLTPANVYASKPASNFTMYNYAVFQNMTADTLQMRWVKTQTVATQKGGQGGSNLGDWGISVQDASNWYSPANGLDSADFILEPVLTSANDKFIMQFYPNGIEGTLKVSFRIFVINNPSDSVSVSFNYTATTPVTAIIEEEKALAEIEVSPNPASDWTVLKNPSDTEVKVELFAPEGRLPDSFSLASKSEKRLYCADRPAGIYFFVVKNGEAWRVIRWVKI